MSISGDNLIVLILYIMYEEDFYGTKYCEIRHRDCSVS